MKFLPIDLQKVFLFSH